MVWYQVPQDNSTQQSGTTKHSNTEHHLLEVRPDQVTILQPQVPPNEMIRFNELGDS